MKKCLVTIASLFLLTACETTRFIEGPTVGEAPPSVTSRIGFNLIAQSAVSNTVTLRASWTAPTSDGRGDPDYYLHTMTANKSVGTLPTRKQVNGLVDTVTITRPAVLDTVILTSSVWSVRRGLESNTAATGRLIIMTADGPPPPPDTVFVDTIILAPSTVQGAQVSVLSMKQSTPDMQLYRSLFIRDESASSTIVQENTTFITLVKE
jgi:hypothetical protein